MDALRFIQVILPLKLDWEPYYRLPEGLDVQVGSRVRVLFANAFYVGCVSAVDVHPELDTRRILPVEALEDGLPDVTPEEIRFWREIAGYYLCSVGEVYKSAYPSVSNHRSRLAIPPSEPQKGEFFLSSAQKEADAAIRAAFQARKTVLLSGADTQELTDMEIYLALETIRQGKSVLLLVPEMGLVEKQAAVFYPSAMAYHSGLTAGKRKLVAEKLRTGEPCLVVGTRMSLFLPFHQLGLVMVHAEHDSFLKQDAPAPRYHARESAIMLAGVHGANVMLTSPTPSLESIYNAQCGRFTAVHLNESSGQKKDTQIEIIDTAAEWRKRGMAGSFSLKLLARIKETLEAGGSVLLLGPRRSYTQGRKMEDEALEYFPEARIGIMDPTPLDGDYDIYIGTLTTTRPLLCNKLKLVALVIGDSLLARQDFRADERAIQVLDMFRSRCDRFVIQTREPAHPVFTHLGDAPVEAMLQERRIAGYPPFTRMVKVAIHDKSEARLKLMTRNLAERLGSIGLKMEGPYTPSMEPMAREMRILLPRDKSLVQKKAAMAEAITAFEQDYKYSSHIVIDVDPV